MKFVRSFIDLIYRSHHSQNHKRKLEIDAFFEDVEREDRIRFNNWRSGIELLDGAEWRNGEIVKPGEIVNIPEPLTPDFGADAVTYETLNYLSDAESSNSNYIEALNPLDQFSIHPILSLSMLLTLGLVLLMVFVVTKKGGGK